MVIRKSVPERIFDLINHFIMLLLILVTLYPFWHIAMASFSNPISLMMHRGGLFWPLDSATLVAYTTVFKNPNIYTGYTNTLFYLAAGTAINIILTTLGAYALSRRDLYFRDHIMLFIAFTMLFSGGMIPTYHVVNTLGMVGTRWSMIVPAAMNTFNLIIMRTSVAAIPDSIEESALIDGANEVQILIRIIIPLSVPIIAVMALYYGVYHWNSWFPALLYLTTRRDYWPLQLFLREILIMSKVDLLSQEFTVEARGYMENIIKYAMIIIATVPIMLVYPMLQRYFVKGVMVGAIKG